MQSYDSARENPTFCYSCNQSHTVAVWTEKQFIPLLTRPHQQGSQGYQKMRQDPLNLNLEVWCANMEPKLYNLWKTVKIAKKSSKKQCFLTVFQRLCNLGSILAHQTSKFEFNGSWHIFWHPWEHVNSGDKRVLRFVFDFSACQCHLADFFILLKLKPDVTFYGHNGWIFKVIQAVSVVIWKESELISPVCHRQ